jgi:hypothetical protein
MRLGPLNTEPFSGSRSSGALCLTVDGELVAGRLVGAGLRVGVGGAGVLVAVDARLRRAVGRGVFVGVAVGAGVAVGTGIAVGVGVAGAVGAGVAVTTTTDTTSGSSETLPSLITLDTTPACAALT